MEEFSKTYYNIIIDKLKEKIKFLKKNFSGEHIFRCPYCGDSQKQNKGHLYINVNKLLYNCFRCGTSGSVQKLLNDLKIDCKINLNVDVTPELPIINQNNKILFKNNILENEIKKENFKQYLTQYAQKEIITKNQIIHNYLSDRIGQNIDSLYDLNKNQILFLPYELIIEILIPFFKNNEKELNKPFLQNSIGFFGYNKCLINFRLINQQEDFRYYKICYDIINNSKTTESDFFIIENNNKIQLTTEKTIFITEGVFDCINVYLNYKRWLKKYYNDEPDIVVATLGKALFYNCVLFVINKYVQPVNLYFFMDQDFSNNDMYNLYKKLKSLSWFIKNIKVFKNKKFKDFGEYSYIQENLEIIF